MENISKAEFVRTAQANKLVYLVCEWGANITLETIKAKIDSFTQEQLEIAVADPNSNRELQNKDLAWLRFLKVKGEECTYLSINGKANTCYKYKNYLITYSEHFNSRNERSVNSLIYQVGTEIVVADQRIKLVVVNEHTLGFIDPRTPKTYSILHASVLKGATWKMHPSSESINPTDKIRLAKEIDFAEFKVYMEGYKNEEQYEWDKESPYHEIDKKEQAYRNEYSWNGGSHEEDMSLNDISRERIKMFYKVNDRCYLGKFNKENSEPILVEYEKQMIYNFEYDFIVKLEDALLVSLLNDYHNRVTKGLDLVFARIKELKGQLLSWV